MPPAPPTGFGGYRWDRGSVHEISAEWRVPAITSSRIYAGEATWIGAQGVSPDLPFIQLGTTGISYPGSNKGTQNGYVVFWSDTARDFHIIPIVGLKFPGNLFRFEMLRNAVGWQLSVKDLTDDWHKTIEVRYGDGDPFTQGEWTQEDPSNGQGSDVTYADTSKVSFQNLRINGAKPTLRYEDEGALSTSDGVYLVPTPVRHDAFTMVAPQGAALQYLADAQRFDSAANPLIDHLFSMFASKRRPTSADVGIVSQVAFLYGASAHIDTSQTWPASARSADARLAGEAMKLSSRLLEWADGKGHARSQLAQAMDDLPFHLAAEHFRKVLGLPPI